MSHNSPVQRAGWDSSNALDLHSRGTRFEEEKRHKVKRKGKRKRRPGRIIRIKEKSEGRRGENGGEENRKKRTQKKMK
jgi:hypothetical protein